MFEALVISLLTLWALGLITSTYLGGLINIFPLLAIGLVLYRFRRRGIS
ncbi:DUF5670 family protein [Pseudomonas nitroreducens]